MSAAAIIGAVGAALRVLAEVLRLRRRPAGPTHEQRAELDVHKARAQTAAGDARSINARTERNRIQRRLHGLVPALLVPACLMAAGCGCASLRGILWPSEPAEPAEPATPAVVVVSADRYVYPLTNAVGIVGWFVPAAVMADYQEALVLCNYYRAKEQNK